jgi:hypothetical protein
LFKEVDMTRHATTWRTILRRAATMLIGAGGVFALATAAQAHDDWHHWKKHHRHFIPPGHVYYAPPVYYAPRPVVVYQPRPVYYAPEPMYYGPPPGLNLNFNVPLR